MKARKYLYGFVALLTVGLFALAGCGDSLTMSDPQAAGDEETLREFLEDDEIFDDIGFYSAERTTVESGGGDRGDIDPLTYWRVLTEAEVDRETIIDYEAGTADVTVNRDAWGELHILDEDMVEYVKPFHHEGIRYASFILDDDWEPPQGGGQDGSNGQGVQHRPRRGPWVLTELSGYRAQSDTLSFEIDWVHVQSESVDVTITDPLELLTVPDDIMKFRVGDEVTVTVSGPPEDAILFLHRRFWRSPFTDNGDGTFTGCWTVSRPGHHTAWVEATSHETIFDSEHPEETLIWGMPYAVARDGVE